MADPQRQIAGLRSENCRLRGINQAQADLLAKYDALLQAAREYAACEKRPIEPQYRQWMIKMDCLEAALKVVADLDGRKLPIVAERKRGRPRGRKCHHCNGDGHIQPKHGLVFRICGACQGTGIIK